MAPAVLILFLLKFTPRWIYLNSLKVIGFDQKFNFSTKTDQYWSILFQNLSFCIKNEQLDAKNLNFSTKKTIYLIPWTSIILLEVIAFDQKTDDLCTKSDQFDFKNFNCFVVLKLIVLGQVDS